MQYPENRIYTGKLIWNRHHYDKNQKTKKGYAYVKNSSDKIIIAQGKHEAIISEEDFSLAQEKLKLRRVEIKGKGAIILYQEFFIALSVTIGIWVFHLFLITGQVRRKDGIGAVAHYKSFIRCKNKSVKAEDIEPKVAVLLDCLLRSKTLKSSRWTTVTAAKSSCMDSRFRGNDIDKVKNRLKSNLQKQSKLTDAYLENLLSEELYKHKNEGLRQEEEELKKLIALQEVREIERERSKDYINRVEEFLEGYDPNKKVMDKETKKLILNLLFKNIKIAHKKIFSFEFFAPFNFFFFEEKQKCQPENLKRVMKNLRRESISGLSDVR